MRKRFFPSTAVKVLSTLPIIVCLLHSFSVLASEPQASANTKVSLSIYKKASFNPSRKETFIFPIQILDAQLIKVVAIEIQTHDDDVVRRLMLNAFEKDKQAYQLEWDGKDSQKKIVPNEVYYPVLVIIDKQDKKMRIDPRDYSGGEEVYNFDKKVTANTVEYSLPVASRLLIRSGIKNGPMLRTVIDWEPRTAGFHIERWSGRDADNVMNISENPKIAYLIIGYQLPDHSVITYGNTQETYRAYRERKQWPIKKANFENRLLVRGKKRIRSEFYTPVLQQKSPRISANLLELNSRQPIRTVKGFAEVLTKVKLNTLDEMYLDQERYEITFFVDNIFIAEEEQGFVPFTWRWSPGRYGIKPGDHILTVNVSGYNGQVGVKNILFTLVEEQRLSHD